MMVITFAESLFKTATGLNTKNKKEDQSLCQIEQEIIDD